MESQLVNSEDTLAEKFKEEFKDFKYKTQYFLASTDFIGKVPDKYQEALRAYQPISSNRSQEVL